MADILVQFVVTVEADDEFTEEEKVAQTSQVIKDQAVALRRIYDTGIALTGTITAGESDEEEL